jgi:hypothetical protein
MRDFSALDELYGVSHKGNLKNKGDFIIKSDKTITQ